MKEIIVNLTAYKPVKKTLKYLIHVQTIICVICVISINLKNTIFSNE